MSMSMPSEPVGEAARRDRAGKIALFRYQLICPALDTELSTKQRGRIVRELASREHTDPFGNRRRYCRDTLDRWIRGWRRGGFDALVPQARAFSARTDAAALELAAALKRENPARTAAQVKRILERQTGWSPSESTLLRLFRRLGINTPSPANSTGVFGRFEAAEANERWTGDGLHGPRVGGRKTYLFAVLDDHSRLITGYRFGFAEDTVRLAAALRPAIAARGIPAALYVDNGSAFVDSWLLRAAATLGIRLVHSTPHRPQGRGKVERLFRTVRDQFLVEITDTTADELTEQGTDHAAALLELNRLFTAWVEVDYHRRVHTETGQTPLERWEASWALSGKVPAIPDPADLTEAFLWSEQRRVTKTATVSLHNNVYEVDPALVAHKVELVFDPFDLTRIEVRYDGRSYGQAIPHSIGRHAHPKARPETPPAPSPAPTGINYAELTAEIHHQQIRDAERINYTDLANTGTIDAELPGQLSIHDALHDNTTEGDIEEGIR